MDRRPGLRLEGKVAVVTGAGAQRGSGASIGKATAVLFAREGAKVVLVDRVVEWAQETQSMISREDGEAVVVEADVSEAEGCRRAAESGRERRHQGARAPTSSHSPCSRSSCKARPVRLSRRLQFVSERATRARGAAMAQS